MTTTDPYAGFGTKKTSQRQPVLDRPEQVKNNAGGYVFEIDKLAQFKRFLTMGTAGGTYYVGQDALTQENVQLILELTRDEATQIEAVDILTEISLAGRAAKQNPTFFALAIFCQHGSTAAKQHARQQITKVVRTGTHLFIFVRYLKQFGGWSRGLRKAVGAWYTEKDADKLAYQLVKYRQREGYTHRDVLRLTHPKVDEPLKRATINWAVKGEWDEQVPSVLFGYKRANTEGANVPEVLGTFNLPWEALPDSAMNDPKVWDKMLDNGVPVGALLRQLPRLTKLGMIPQMGGRTDDVIARLVDPEQLEKARIHPINVLLAIKTYARGHSQQGSGVWTPTTKIIDGLDEMFHRSFGFVQPTGKRTLLALDISRSMGTYLASEKFPLTAAEISAAMALTTAKIEARHQIMGFSSRSGTMTRDPADSKLINLNISPRQRLDDVMRTTQEHVFGGTDVALPMVTALREGWSVDTFVVYTDNETWHGYIHPFQALKQYRRETGIDAKLIVVAATPTRFTVADPSDPGMLDISGFDSAVPQLISDFSTGEI